MYKVLRTVPGIQYTVSTIFISYYFYISQCSSRVPLKVLGYMTLTKIRQIKTQCRQVYGKTDIVNGNVKWSNPLEDNCSVCMYFALANTLLEMCPVNIHANVHQQNYLKLLTKMPSQQNWEQLKGPSVEVWLNTLWVQT